MRTYFDESGIFIDPQGRNTHKVSLMGALTIPDASYAAVSESFIKIRTQWGAEKEVKGNALTEDQVRSLTDELEKHNVLFCVTIVDSKFLSSKRIAKHKSSLSAFLLSNISPFHHPDLKQQITALRNDILKIADQLYIQCLAQISIIRSSHQLSTVYYVQRMPGELGRFQWVIDAKEKAPTTSEKWWKTLASAFIQQMSIQRPLIMLEDEDYSYYHQFDSEGNSASGNINMIFANLSFRDSNSEIGIQIVDILTSALQRAMNQKFQKKGWIGIGKLMSQMNNENLRIILLDGPIPKIGSLPYHDVLISLNKEFKSILVAA